MTSCIKILLSIFIVLILIASASPVFAQENKPRALEIVYPTFGGEGGTLDSESGLPEYIQYFFKFALGIIGFIILAIMVNNGLGYILSAGNAEKLLAARQGITASFVGALVLVGAVILFNTINPNIIKLDTEDLTLVDPVIQPGIYLCNYYSTRIPTLILTYTSKNASIEEKLKAVEEIKGLMKNDNGSCYRVNYSANLDTGDLEITKNEGSMFVVPKRVFDNPETLDTDESGWNYNYGVIFHEKDNWKGKCAQKDPYNTLAIWSFSFLDFDRVESITLYEKPANKPSPSSQKVVLYNCLGYNEGQCPKDEQPAKGSFGPIGDSYFRKYSGEDQLLKLYKNARSINIDPTGGYFAVMYSGLEYGGATCEVISKNDNNLLDQPIGQCRTGNTYLGECKSVLDFNQDTTELIRDCGPCLESMIVVEGNVIY